MSSGGGGSSNYYNGVDRLRQTANSGTVDPTTQKELLTYAYNTEQGKNGNVSKDSIEGLISDVNSGNGMYGIRRKNWELAKLLLDKPGRQQTILSVDAGGGAKGPVASGTLLTTGGNR